MHDMSRVGTPRQYLYGGANTTWTRADYTTYVDDTGNPTPNYKGVSINAASVDIRYSHTHVRDTNIATWVRAKQMAIGQSIVVPALTYADAFVVEFSGYLHADLPGDTVMFPFISRLNAAPTTAFELITFPDLPAVLGEMLQEDSNRAAEVCRRGIHWKEQMLIYSGGSSVAADLFHAVMIQDRKGTASVANVGRFSGRFSTRTLRWKDLATPDDPMG